MANAVWLPRLWLTFHFQARLFFWRKVWLSLFLTFGADVSAALGDDGFSYDGSASGAGLALAVKDVERFSVVSVFPISADEVALGVAEARSGIGDAFPKDALYGVPQGFRFV